MLVNNMCIWISIHCLHSQREAFCFTGPWINHIFYSSILSSIMHFFFWVRPSMIILVTDWVNRWDHGCMIFSLLWDTGTPIFSGATSISPPLPSFHSLPSAVILVKGCYLYPSSQVSQVKTASQQTREAHCYMDVLLCFYKCTERCRKQ